MIDTPPKQFPSFEHPNTLVYLGTSMNPTMEDLDVIQFHTYQGTPPRKGDVIVIQRHEEPEQIIIHRIIAIDPGGIRTQGDNCSIMDSWILMPSEILGYVTNARRENRIIYIHRGRSGYQKFLFRRTIRETFTTCRTIAKQPYQWFSALKLPARLLSPFLTYRIMTFSGSDRSETQLFLGPVFIGRLQKGSAIWEIKTPYRLLIDPALLPSLGRDRDSDILFPNENVSIK